MDVKDQRLELRISQQQLDELDEIRSSANSPYPLTRSDVARMYITQGIERHKQGQEEASAAPRELSLGERLSVFFHLEQLLQRSNQGNASAHHHEYKATSIDNFELVKTVYSKRFLWFFELEPEALKELSRGFQSDALLSLLDRRPNAQTSRDLKYVCEVVRMLASIERCMSRTEFGNGVAETIQRYSQRKGVPLKFPGFPENYQQFNEMAGLVRWVDGRKNSDPIWTGASEHDYSPIFDQMLVVYREFTKEHDQIELEDLQDMILDARIG